MKIIDKNNIEEYLFDYFEGNLTDSEKIQVTDFLNKHPEFQADYEAWKRSYVVEPPMVYPNADKLLVKGSFNKKIFWFFGTVSVGVITALFLMFGDFSSEMQPAASTHLIKTDTPFSQKQITQEEKPSVKINEPSEIYLADKNENAILALNKLEANKEISRKEMPKKHFSQIAEQPIIQPVTQEVLQPVFSEKNAQEEKMQEKLPTEIPVDAPIPIVADNLLPEKPLPGPETSKEQLNDSTVITNQPEAAKNDSVNESGSNIKEKKKGNFKWKIKVIPVNNFGL